MRFAPTSRLLRLAAVLAVPLAGAGGLVSALAAPCFALLAVAALVAVWDAYRGRRRLEAVRIACPETVRLTKDAASALPIEIENGLPAALVLKLAPALPPGVSSEKTMDEVEAPPGRSLYSWRLTGRERGDLELQRVYLATASPLGWWEARAELAVACRFRIYPNLRDRSTAALFLRTPQIGLRMHRQVGKGREFENLRQYLSGDAFEDIHWKATARRSFPVVKLYRVEHAQEVYAVIDASRLSAREGILESYVDAALHLALVAEKQGDRFGLVTFSDRTHRFVRARNGLDHFRLCRETIYNLRAERVSPDFREVFTSLQLHLRQRSLVVFLTSLDDALLAESFERDIGLVARRHLVLVNVRQTAALTPLFQEEPPTDLDALYGGLAGQMQCNRMRALAAALGNRGVRLSVVSAERIKQQVAEGYLDVKRRQAL
ncbi:MAG: DUF58 domain-containing protein [Bryobacteraceae bacterium]|jgi:uncharacterized protein (DUF58 family)